MPNKKRPIKTMKSRRRVVKNGAGTPRSTYAELRQQLTESLQREKAAAAKLDESLQRETATREILALIAQTPIDLQTILAAIAEKAARLCDAKDALVFRVDGDVHHRVAVYGSIPAPGIGLAGPNTRGTPVGRAIVDAQTIHVRDILTEVETEFPEYKALQLATGTRTMLSAPLLKNGVPLGVIHIRRTEVRPFRQEQIKLLETFADQAVIAVEKVRLFQQLNEALEQQTATSEILGVIASSPTDLTPVLETVAKNAATLCGASSAQVFRLDGEVLRLAANYGELPSRETRPIARDTVAGRAFVDRKTIHVHNPSESAAEFPESSRALGQTRLATPLLRDDVALGVIGIRRTDMRPFTESQIKLVETFANQAVIAIENVRLFKELQERNAELREALEHQTATSEVLGIISRSPTDVQPVLDAIVESAAKVCGVDDVVLRLREGNAMVLRAHFGPIPVPANNIEIDIDEPQYRWIREHGTLHVPDLSQWNDFQLARARVWRSRLTAPLRQRGEIIGALNARRTEVRPFSPAQVKLLETFAEQAVIALENARLFQELKESLEQQTATSEILGVIASSPTDIQPVLDTIAQSAARVCGSDDATIRLLDGDTMSLVAHYGTISPGAPRRPLSWHTPGNEAMVRRRTVHIPDVLTEVERFPDSGPARDPRRGIRTFLSAPMLTEGVPIGVINIRRMEVRPFSDRQIKLLETFADQAVIAIVNVRLFKELQERNAELREALEQQTATSEILRVIASSPTDVQPVLDVLVKNAAQLCEATDAVIGRLNGEVIHQEAKYGTMPVPGPRQITRGTPVGRAIIEKKTIHIHDHAVAVETDFPESKARQEITGNRSMLVTPLLREGASIGAIVIRRKEVRPFTDQQIKLLETFADQAVIAIENVRLFKELQERTRELMDSVEEMKALGEVGQAVSSSLDLETVLETIVSRAVDLSGTDGGVIYEFDEQTQEFVLQASHRMEAEAVEGLRSARIKLGEGATGQAALRREPVQIPDTVELRERAVSRVRPLLNRLGYRSLLTVPILREQQIMGGLTVWRKQVGEFQPEVINLLQTFATQSALAIQNARLFREIEDKSRQIEAANRHKSEFLANMSHELRTPLNAIIGFSEVLQEKLFGELNEKQAEYTEDILTSGRHLLSLINEILDLSKVEAGRMELETAPFDLPLAIDNARTFVRERAAKHGIAVDVDVDERLGEYVGDERKIKQILLNLLSNAVKFTPEGGRIGINARQVDGSVEISVSDTGIGIAAEDQPKIFEEFRQVGSDYSHKVEGTGLGLTLAKKFVELHGGRIWVESEPGMGSTFTFVLPLKVPRLDL